MAPLVEGTAKGTPPSLCCVFLFFLFFFFFWGGGVYIYIYTHIFLWCMLPTDVRTEQLFANLVGFPYETTKSYSLLAGEQKATELGCACFGLVTPLVEGTAKGTPPYVLFFMLVSSFFWGIFVLSFVLRGGCPNPTKRQAQSAAQLC